MTLNKCFAHLKISYLERIVNDSEKQVKIILNDHLLSAIIYKPNIHSKKVFLYAWLRKESQFIINCWNMVKLLPLIFFNSGVFKNKLSQQLERKVQSYNLRACGLQEKVFGWEILLHPFNNPICHCPLWFRFVQTFVIISNGKKNFIKCFKSKDTGNPI